MKRFRLIVVGRSTSTIGENLPYNLNTVQNEFDFSPHDAVMPLPNFVNTRRPVPIQTLRRLGMDLVAEKYPGEYPVVLCECRLEGNYFSDIDEKVAVISTHGWTKEFSPYPVERYLTYSMADVLMTSLAINTPVHEDETRGCVGDYCKDKKDINIGLEICDYCPECQAVILNEVGKGRITLSQSSATYRILDFAAGRKRCFVLMPFAKEFDPVYKKCIEPTLSVNKWNCTRADKIFQPREVIQLIWEQVLRADLIIADLTGRNPNVFYELGYAHALHKKTVLITQSIDDVPFDLRHRQMVGYSATPKGYESLKKSLKEYV